MREPMDTPKNAVVATAEQTAHALSQGKDNQQRLLNIVQKLYDVDNASTYVKKLNHLTSWLINPDESLLYQLDDRVISDTISRVNSLSEFLVELQEAWLTNQYKTLSSRVNEFFDFDNASSYVKTLNFLLNCVTDTDETIKEGFSENWISNTRNVVNSLSEFVMELQEVNYRMVAIH